MLFTHQCRYLNSKLIMCINYTLPPTGESKYTPETKTIVFFRKLFIHLLNYIDVI